jgi:predicted TIM-barrel fold metal-dependent hydrolase
MSTPSGHPVFDFHARLTPTNAAAARLLSIMDRCGIARAAVSAGGVVDLDQLAHQIVHGGRSTGSPDNEAVLRAAEDSGGRLVPFFFGNPHAPIREYAKRGHHYRGLEISPAVHGVGFYHPGVRDLVEVAQQHGHPVYTVCVPASGGGTADLLWLVKGYPDVTFVFGHCGYLGIDTHALKLLAPYPNVVAEISGCFSVTARTAIERLGADRVVFGTEYPLQHPDVELAKLASLRLSTSDERKVAWSNAHRLLNLTVPAIPVPAPVLAPTSARAEALAVLAPSLVPLSAEEGHR